MQPNENNKTDLTLAHQKGCEMKLLKLLAIAALTIPAVSYAACPKTLSGVYSGLLFTDSFLNDDTTGYNDKSAAVIRLAFDGKGTATTEGSVNLSGYSKNSAEQTAQELGLITPVKLTYTFDTRSCFGSATFPNGQVNVFTVTQSGNQLMIINYFEPNKASLSGDYERDTNHGIFFKQ